jgi:hypothetical protein
MLVCGGNVATIFEGPKEIASGEIFDLLQERHARLQKAFGPGVSSRAQLGVRAGNCTLAADRAGNFWFLQSDGRLLVEVGGAWKDANEALTKAGSSAGRVLGLSLLEDGSKTYLFDENFRTLGGRRFLGEVQGHDLLFTSAPPQSEYARGSEYVIDRQGMLWSDGAAGAPWASRIGNGGVVQELTEMGRAVFADAAGNVWLRDRQITAQDHFHIWREGQIVQDLQVPQADARTFFVSDRPGSVYACTAGGLQHLLADGPSFDRYRLGKSYALEAMVGQTLSHVYSKHGYLAMLNAVTSRTEAPYYLYLVALPKPSDEAKR